MKKTSAKTITKYFPQISSDRTYVFNLSPALLLIEQSIYSGKVTKSRLRKPGLYHLLCCSLTVTSDKVHINLFSLAFLTANKGIITAISWVIVGVG